MAFSANDWIAFLPETILVLFALLVTLLAAWVGDNPKGRQLVRQTVLLAYALALVAVLVGQPERSELFNGLFVSGGVLSWFKGLVLAGAFAAGWMTTQKWDEGVERAEYPLLVLLATLGMCLMISANDLMALYMGLELQSLPLFVIAAMRTRSLKSSEAGLKYFLLGALSSGMLLYGASLIYGFVGTTSFTGIAETLAAGPASAGVTVGLVFLLSGLAFKISAAPFHMWTPDVYEGAPTPVTALFAIAPKVAAMALLLSVTHYAFGPIAAQWSQVLVALSVASMLVGAFGALRQTDIKRMMAYSSIAHMGYALIGLAAGSPEGASGVLIYMTTYLVMGAGSFAIIMSMRREETPVQKIADLAGASSTHPLLAAGMMLAMFSMAGIPPLAGFFGKWYVFVAAVNAGLIPLAVIGVLASVVGAFYYLRIIRLMYFQEPDEPLDRGMPRQNRAVLLVSLVVIVLFVFAIGPLRDYASQAVQELTGNLALLSASHSASYSTSYSG